MAQIKQKRVKGSCCTRMPINYHRLVPWWNPQYLICTWAWSFVVVQKLSPPYFFLFSPKPCSKRVIKIWFPRWRFNSVLRVKWLLNSHILNFSHSQFSRVLQTFWLENYLYSPMGFQSSISFRNIFLRDFICFSATIISIQCMGYTETFDHTTLLEIGNRGESFGPWVPKCLLIALD